MFDEPSARFTGQFFYQAQSDKVLSSSIAHRIALRRIGTRNGSAQQFPRPTSAIAGAPDIPAVDTADRGNAGLSPAPASDDGRKSIDGPQLRERVGSLDDDQRFPEWGFGGDV